MTSDAILRFSWPCAAPTYIYSPRIREDFYYRAHSVPPLAPSIRPRSPRPIHPPRTQRRRRLRLHWTLRHRLAPYD